MGELKLATHVTVKFIASTRKNFGVPCLVLLSAQFARKPTEIAINKP